MIRTPRLTLRKPRPGDLADLHRVFSNPQAMRYWSRPEHQAVSETESWLSSMIATNPAEGDDYLIEYQGRVVGKAGAWRLPEIGYILHPDHWRQGLVSEALTALIPHLFIRHDLPFLTAEIDPRNTASHAMLTRFGFYETHRAERTLLWRDEWCDSIYFRLDRPAPGDSPDQG